MTRQTNIDTFHKIKTSGLLSPMRWRVYEALYLHGPLTGKELDAKLHTDSAHKRLSELKTLKVVDDSGEMTRVCRISGEHVVEWDVTAHLPVKAVRAPAPGARPSDRTLDKAVDELRELWTLGQAVRQPPSQALIEVARWLATGAR